MPELRRRTIADSFEHIPNTKVNDLWLRRDVKIFTTLTIKELKSTTIVLEEEREEAIAGSQHNLVRGFKEHSLPPVGMHSLTG